MIAGLPGTGIGGVFYIASAVFMPLHRALRGGGHAGRSWRRVALQCGIAFGILGALFVTGWLLGLVIAPSARLAVGGTAGGVMRGSMVLGVARWVAVVGTAGLLALVLVAVEVAALLARRRRPVVTPGPPLLPADPQPVRRPKRRRQVARATLPLLCLFAAADVRAQDIDLARILARADSAFLAADSAAARAAYGELLLRAPAHSRATYQLARLEPRGSSEQLRLFRRYTELEPQDPWGWSALGEAYADAGERAEAVVAYRHAVELAPDEAEFAAGLRAVEGPRQRRRFSLEPTTRGTGDSDGNRSTRTGMAGFATLGARNRLGLEASRLTLRGDGREVPGWEAAATGEWRPSSALLMSGRAGVISAQDELAGADVREPIASARARWRPARGPALELRWRYEPLTATPQLLASPVLLNEIRAVLELPVLEPFYVRGVARHGRLRDPNDINTRTMYGVGPVLRLTPALELNALAGRSGYAHATGAGYFAPERVDVIDAGFYWEYEGDGPLVLALDAGGGVERITRFDEPPGGWGRALRLWTQVSWSLSASAALRLEAEAYDTRAGEVVAAGGEGWRWGSLAVAVVIRP